MQILPLCGVCILTAVALVCLKQLRPEFCPLLRLCFTILCGTIALSKLTRVTELLSQMADPGGSMMSWVLGVMGVAVICQTVAAVCRDCGETTLAQSVEIVGKLEILLSCLPLLQQILDLCGNVLSFVP